MEIIDAQIHEPGPTAPTPRYLTNNTGQFVRDYINVEIAREAIDCVGVDKALVFARQDFNQACVDNYPDRFAGVLVFNHMADDLEEQIANYRKIPGMLAGRNLVTDFVKLKIRDDFHNGNFDRYWAYAEKHKLPLFCSTHGEAHEMSKVCERHPDLTIIVDHFGVSQSPVSPVIPDKWGKLPGTLSLAKYPNVYVKFCGGPVMSDQDYPYEDIWPHLHQILKAFGPERCMWASDYTRMRWLPSDPSKPPGPPGMAPRSQWKLYSECRDYLLKTNEISESDKEHLFNKAVRRALNWTD